MIILGLDPGTRNFGWAVTRFTDKGFEPLYAGKIVNPVVTMDDTVTQTRTFLTEIEGIIAKYKPDYIVAERFLNRGRFNGATGEYVSFMLGVIALYVLKGKRVKGFHIVHSGTWKTAYNRLSKVKGVLDKTYAYALCEPHELDAYLLTHFIHKEVGSGAFAPLKGKPLSKSDVQVFESVATGKKKRKRK